MAKSCFHPKGVTDLPMFLRTTAGGVRDAYDSGVALGLGIAVEGGAESDGEGILA
jgi:hypothetical protein